MSTNLADALMPDDRDSRLARFKWLNAVLRKAQKVADRDRVAMVVLDTGEACPELAFEIYVAGSPAVTRLLEFGEWKLLHRFEPKNPRPRRIR